MKKSKASISPPRIPVIVIAAAFWLIPMLIMLTFGGCGRKGGLYIPDAQVEVQQTLASQLSINHGFASLGLIEKRASLQTY